MFRYLPVRTLSTQWNRNPGVDSTFIFSKCFEYLTRSQKYEQYLSAIKSSELSKFDRDISTKYKESRFLSFKDYDHLELRSRVMLCDSINAKYLDDYGRDIGASEENFRKFFDSFFRTKFKLLLKDKFNRSSDYKNSFLLSIDPELYVKILYYYGNFYFPGELNGYEITFLQDYLTTSTSSNFKYEMYELMAIMLSTVKLSLKLDPISMNKLIDSFKQANDQDQRSLFHGVIRLIRQQEYFDENLIKSVKQILKQNQHVMKSRAIINILYSLSSFAYHDPEIIEAVAQSLCSRDDLQLQDVTKLLWSCASLDYDFNENPKFLQFVLTELRSSLKREDRRRTINAILAVKFLILCNVYHLDTFNSVLNNPEIRKDLIACNRKFKVNSDLFFIIKSLEIEKPNFPIDYALKQVTTPILQDLKLEHDCRLDFNDFIKFLTSNLNCNFDYEFVYPLPHFNISSILLTYFENRVKKMVLIDLIDRSNTMRNDANRPKVYFKVKLRQLQAKGMSFVLYRRSDNSFVKV